MATADLIKVAPKVLINNGTTAQGDVKTATISYASSANATMTDDAAYSIAQAIAPILSSTVYMTRIDKQYSLEE